MVKKSCPKGANWDYLVDKCMPSKPTMGPNTDPPREHPRTAGNQFKGKPNTLVVLSSTPWIFVVLVVVGSISALTVWFIICRRQTRRGSTCVVPRVSPAPSPAILVSAHIRWLGKKEDGKPGLKPLQKAAPPVKLQPLPSEKNDQAEIFQSVAEAPPPCFHVHPGSQMGSKWEDDFTASRDLMMHAGAEAGGGSPACSTMAEHRIPLPATELGGTALVTTKTM